MWYLVTLSFNALIQYSIHNTQKWLSWCILQTRCWNVTDKGSEWKRQWENCNIRKHECSSNNTNENLHPNYLISTFQRFLQQKDLNSSLVSAETSHGTYVQHGAWMQLMALLNMRKTLKMLLNFKNSMLDFNRLESTIHLHFSHTCIRGKLLQVQYYSAHMKTLHAQPLKPIKCAYENRILVSRERGSHTCHNWTPQGLLNFWLCRKLSLFFPKCWRRKAIGRCIPMRAAIFHPTSGRNNSHICELCSKCWKAIHNILHGSLQIWNTMDGLRDREREKLEE